MAPALHPGATSAAAKQAPAPQVARRSCQARSLRNDHRLFVSAPAEAVLAAPGLGKAPEARDGATVHSATRHAKKGGSVGSHPLLSPSPSYDAREPSASDRGGVIDLDRRLMTDAADLLTDYLASSADPREPVVRLASPQELREAFDGAGVPLDIDDCQQPVGGGQVLDSLKTVLRYSVRMQSPLFFNQLSARPDAVGVVGDWVVAAAHAPVHTFEVSPVFTEAEKAVLSKMARCIGGAYAAAHDGLFVPGGSIANLYGLLLARHAKFPSSRDEGLAGLPRMAVFCSEQAHFSVRKCAAVAGLGMASVVPVPCDARGRMRPDALRAKIREVSERGVVPLCVFATAGTTVLGGFDPLCAVHDVCREMEVWMHVDGSWGASVMLSERHRGLVDGIELADSVAWSPHKMLGAPLQCSAVLTRHVGALADCNSTHAEYLYQPDKLHADCDLGDKSIQCSRRADAFKAWLMWKARGDVALAQRVDRSLDLASHFAQKAQAHPSGAFRLVAPRNGANVCFWVLPERMRVAAGGASANPASGASWAQSLGPEDREALAAVAPVVKRRMQAAGDAMVGYQPLGDLPPFFRMVVVNGDGVEESHLDAVLDRMAYVYSSGL